MFLLTINPFFTRGPRLKGFEGITTKYALYNTFKQTCMQDKTEYLVMAPGREDRVQEARKSLVTNKRVSTGSNSRSNVPCGKTCRRCTPVASLVTACALSPQRVLAPRSVNDARSPISLQGSAHESQPGLFSRQGPSRGPSSTGGSRVEP